MIYHFKITLTSENEYYDNSFGSVIILYYTENGICVYLTTVCLLSIMVDYVSAYL